MKKRIFYTFIWVSFVLNHSIAQTPTFKLMKPAGTPDINADFIYESKNGGEFGDYDGDGDLDMLQISNQASKFILFENDGSGNFTNLGVPSFNDLISTDAHGDFVFVDMDNNGLIDLLSSGGSRDSTTLYWGDGAGNFTASGIKFHSSYQGQVAVIDIDSDDDLDVVVSGIQRSVSIGEILGIKIILYLNDGSQNFTASTSINHDTNTNTRFAISEAFDGNKRNLIAQCEISGVSKTSLFHYDGAGNYSLISDTMFDGMLSSSRIKNIAMGELNGDGIEDVVIVDAIDGIRLFTHDGAMNYGHLNTSPIDGLGSAEVAFITHIEDLDGDMDLDIVYSNITNGFEIYQNDGTGSFSISDQHESSEWVSFFMVGDITGDGLADLNETVENGVEISNLSPVSKMNNTYVNGGSCTFNRSVNYAIKEVGEGGILTADFDKNGVTDALVFGREFSSDLDETDLYLNDGAISFSKSGNFLQINSFHSAAAVVDFNQDTNPDILVTGVNGSSLDEEIKLYENDGTGLFTENKDHPFPALAKGDILVFQANEDYNPDVLFIGENQGIAQARLYRGTGEGNFKLKSFTGLDKFTECSADAADIDLDGDQDLIIAGQLDGADQTMVYLNEGTGNFTASGTIALQGISDGDVKFLLFNEDDIPDILLAGSDHQLIYLSDGLGGYSLSQTLTGLTSATVEGTDIDKDGDIDFISTGESLDLSLPTSVIYINDGTGNFTDTGVDLHGVKNASISFADFDGDFDEELLLVGSEGERLTSNSASGEIYKYHDRGYLSRVYENTTSISTVNLEISSCDSYFFVDETISSSGNYAKVITTPEGENRTINLALTIQDSYTQTVDLTVSGSYTFNGVVLEESGTYQSKLLNSNGCDSLVTLNLTVNDFVSSSEMNALNFELIQPSGSSALSVDFDKSCKGAGLFYDMDGDGDIDYLQFGDVARGFEGGNIYLNDGCNLVRQLNPEELLPIGNDNWNHPTVAYGDFNNDGINDLLVGGDSNPLLRFANSGATSRFYWGNANGGLTLNTDINLPPVTWGNFNVADFNNDTYLDIIASGSSGPSVSIYLNDGSGGFSVSTTTAFDDISFGGANAVSEPYNGGIRDILVSGLQGSTGVTSLFRSDAGGNITHISDNTFTAMTFGRHQFADANGDGHQDVLVLGAEAFVNNFYNEIYLGDGVGNYTISTADFDGIVTGDGYFYDLNDDEVAEVILRDDDGNIHVFWNDGSGAFSSKDSYFAGRNYPTLTIGDVNDDAYPDLIATGYNNGANQNPDVFYFINNQSNGFIKSNLSTIEEVSNGEIQFANVDGDSDQDMIVVGNSSNNEKVAKIYTNDGSGNFIEVMGTPFKGTHNADFAIADIDGNTTLDLLIIGDTLDVSDEDVPSAHLYVTDVMGVITKATGIPFEGVSSGDVEFFDADGNTAKDVLIVGKNASSNGVANLYLNDGAGNFSLHSAGVDGVKNADIVVGDVNADLNIDLLVTGTDNSGDATTTLYINDGSGNFTAGFPNNFEGITDGVAEFQDFDGDLDLDIYLSGNGEQLIYLNDGSGNFTLAQSLKSLWRSSVAFSDIDGDDDLDFIAAGNNSFAGYGEKETFLYVNDGSGNYTRNARNQFVGISYGSMAFADVDGDMDNDLLFSGNSFSENGHSARLYRNTIGDSRKAVWSSEAWSRDTPPTAIDEVIIKDDYVTATQGEFAMASLEIRSSNTITVSPNTQLNVTGNLNNNGSIVVESGGSLLTYEVHTVAGNPITFKRNTRYEDNRYSMVGSPVESDASIIGSDLGPTVYAYDETIAFNDGTEDGVFRWLDASSTILESGIGYAAAGQEVITFEGIPNDGTISFTGLSRTEDATTTSDNWGWHLVSNPYPAAIDLSSFISDNTNIQGTIALWDDHGSDVGRGTNADYLIANAIGSVTGPNGGQFEGYIGSMQGFFIQVGDGQSGDLTFTESMRIGGNNGDGTFFRLAEANIPKIKLAISTEDGLYSETLIGFPEDATKGMDRLYDAIKLKGQKDFNIYSVLDEQELAIQGLPLEDEMIIPLGMDLSSESEIQFSIISLEGLEKDYEVYLRNNNQHTLTLMSIDESVNISNKEGGTSKDYSLVVRQVEVLSIEEKLSSFELIAYDDGVQLQLVCDQCTSQADIQVINLSGKVISSNRKVVFNQGKYVIRKPTLSGLYIVQLNSLEGIGYVKLIIK